MERRRAARAEGPAIRLILIGSRRASAGIEAGIGIGRKVVDNQCATSVFKADILHIGTSHFLANFGSKFLSH
jgi:hypothetical protein